MKQTTYENKYGKLVVEHLTDYKPVSFIHGVDLPDDCMFDLDTSEKIVLITENQRSQIGVRPSRRCYLIVHESCSSACAVRIVSMEYTGPDAGQEIERLAPKASIQEYLRYTGMAGF